jgi:hypothetical protein
MCSRPIRRCDFIIVIFRASPRVLPHASLVLLLLEGGLGIGCDVVFASVSGCF